MTEKFCANGHLMTILGGANCGCYPDAACSVPVYSCRTCGDSDYGDNEHATITKELCQEHQECKRQVEESPLEATTLTRSEFQELPEYSATLPTGTAIGKRWRRHDGAHDPSCKDPKWFIGEYVDIGDSKNVGIRWTIPAIVPDDVMKKLREVPA